MTRPGRLFLDPSAKKTRANEPCLALLLLFVFCLLHPTHNHNYRRCRLGRHRPRARVEYSSPYSYLVFRIHLRFLSIDSGIIRHRHHPSHHIAESPPVCFFVPPNELPIAPRPPFAHPALRRAPRRPALTRPSHLTLHAPFSSRRAPSAHGRRPERQP